MRQDTCVGSGDTASPVTAGLHARKAGRGAASARPILNHVQRGFLMVFRPRPSGSSSTLKRVNSCVVHYNRSLCGVQDGEPGRVTPKLQQRAREMCASPRIIPAFFCMALLPVSFGLHDEQGFSLSPLGAAVGQLRVASDLRSPCLASRQRTLRAQVPAICLANGSAPGCGTQILLNSQVHLFGRHRGSEGEARGGQSSDPARRGGEAKDSE